MDVKYKPEGSKHSTALSKACREIRISSCSKSMAEEEYLCDEVICRYVSQLVSNEGPMKYKMAKRKWREW